MSKRIIALLLCLILFLTAIPVSTNAAQTLTITNQPQNAYVSEGEVAKTTVTAQGDGLQYQWYVKTAGSADFVKSSVTKKAYSFTMSAKSSGRQAYCVITDQHGNTVTTNTVTMKIPVPLKILSQPANSYVETGMRAVTSVIAQGEDLQYQWYLKNAGQSKFYLSSVDGNKYAITMSKKAIDRQVYCVITDHWGNQAVSDTVTLSLPAPIMITQQPADGYAFSGDKVSSSVVAEGDSLSYQWYIKNAGQQSFSKSSVTKATYKVTMNEKSDGRQVYCVITDKDGNQLQTKTVTLHRNGVFHKDFVKVKHDGGTRNLAEYLTFNTTNQLTWKSSDTSIAKVDALGMVTGLKDGTVTITVTDKEAGKSVKCKVKVCDLKQVALTFDDGPSKYTRELLDFLRENNIPVTFFLVGNRIKEFSGTVQQAVKDGHEMGYHSYAHKMQTGLSDAQILSDFEKSNELLRELTGAEFTLWRTPGGNYNQRVLDCIDLPHIMWSVDTRDWDHRNSYKVYASVVNASDGAIVLMHDLYGSTVDGAILAMEEMLEGDYEFLTVTELLSRNGSAPQPNTSYARAK
ncbi:MAG: polysaccharide deacetylase family protein [Oscillospiraceae bacterium]|nr:polysaccharide deacetylase family protein [Oscillospiraceae bacterium]